MWCICAVGAGEKIGKAEMIYIFFVVCVMLSSCLIERRHPSAPTLSCPKNNRMVLFRLSEAGGQGWGKPVDNWKRLRLGLA